MFRDLPVTVDVSRVGGHDDCIASRQRYGGRLYAVEFKHHLIVSHEVSHIGHDRKQPAAMAAQARKAMQTEELTVVADRGYYAGTEILT